MTSRCHFCGGPVDTRRKQGWARKVVGWEELRRGGGANKIVRRQTIGQVSHSACLTTLGGQGSLL